MSKKLYRSKKSKIIGGVGGGIAEYFSIDPLIVRLSWALLIVADLSFLVLYIIGMIIIPVNPGEEDSGAETGDRNTKLAMLVGIGFVIWGVVKIAERVFRDLDIRIFPFIRNISVFSWPIVLILIGVIILLTGRRNK